MPQRDLLGQIAGLEAELAEITAILNEIKFRGEPSVAQRVRVLVMLHNHNCSELGEIYTLCTDEPDPMDCGCALRAVRELVEWREADKTEIARLRAALTALAGDRCEHYNTGPGSCFRQGLTDVFAPDGPGQPCYRCVAAAALRSEEAPNAS